MAVDASYNSRTEGSAIGVGLVLLATAILAITGAASAADGAFRTHAWMFLAAAFAGFAALGIWLSDSFGRIRFDPTQYEDGIVKAIHVNAKPLDLTSIPSGAPVRFVLEIPGGRSEEIGLELGDTFEHARVVTRGE